MFAVDRFERVRSELMARRDSDKLRPCITELELSQFEAAERVRLPTGYRRFVLEIGGGGPGPYDGLIPLGGAVPAPPASLARPFLFSRATSLVPVRKRSRLDYRSIDPNTDPHDGCLLLCHHGCATYEVLVVTGEEPDRVWVSANDGVVHPRKQSFLEWYEAWLDER